MHNEEAENETKRHAPAPEEVGHINRYDAAKFQGRHENGSHKQQQPDRFEQDRVAIADEITKL